MTHMPLVSLRVVSHNCRGWTSGYPAVSDLLQICDLCLIQEHWLLHEQLFRLNIHDDFLSVGVSGMESSEFHYGRPFGGCAIFYRKSLTPHVTRLHSPSKRFCSVMFTDQSGSTFLLVCVYLPFYDGSRVSSNEYLIALGELEGFITRHRSDHLLIAGDFNVDFNRNNVNLGHLLHFMSDLHLAAADLPHHSSIQYTYIRDDGTASSWLDHYLCDPSLACGLSNFVAMISVPICRITHHYSAHFLLLFLQFAPLLLLLLCMTILVLLGMLFRLSFLLFSVHQCLLLFRPFLILFVTAVIPFALSIENS